jgi:hypothetical protein
MVINGHRLWWQPAYRKMRHGLQSHQSFQRAKACCDLDIRLCVCEGEECMEVDVVLSVGCEVEQI